MKKFLKLTLLMAMTFLCFVLAFSACRPEAPKSDEDVHDPYEGMTFSPYHNATEESYILTSYTGTAQSVTVPGEYNGVPVVAIGTGAFDSCSNLQSVTLGEGICYVEENAFISCPALQDIFIPSSVTFIAPTMVYECRALERLSVHSENSVYSGSFGLVIEKSSQKVILGTKTAYFDQDADIKVIGQGAFANTDLEKLNLPNTVVEIQAFAFAGCPKLTVVELPESVASIGDNAFAGCENLRMVNISKNTTVLGERLFYQCPKLERIIIPDGVTELRQEIFYGCSSLNQIVIGKDVSSVAYNAFWGCTSLKDIYYAGTPESWQKLRVDSSNSSYFPTVVYYRSDMGSLDTLRTFWCYEYGSNYANNGRFYEDSGYNNWGTYWGVPTLIGDAFYEYRDFVFVLNSDGKSYALKSAGWNFEEYEGAGFSRIAIPATYKGLPVTVIRKNAFAGGTLEEVLLPASIQVIEDEAFYTSPIKKIFIPANVTKIGVLAFGCTNSLGVIEVDERNPVYHSAGNCLIETATRTLIVGCKNSEIPKDGSVKKIGAHAFYWCHGLGHSFEIPEGVTHIGEMAFDQCYGLMRIVLPKTLTQIDDWAFQGCVTLLEIDNRSSIKISAGNSWEHGGIGYYAKHIYNSDKSNENSILSVGGFSTSHVLVFYRDADGVYTLLGASWNDYETIWLPATCNGERYRIYEYAFFGNEMTSLEIRGGALEIGPLAFGNCDNLETVLIHKEVGKIAPSAFRNCSSLKSIYYSGSYEEWCAAGHDKLTLDDKVTCYFYSETQPTDTNHQYWHYVNDTVAPW